MISPRLVQLSVCCGEEIELVNQREVDDNEWEAEYRCPACWQLCEAYFDLIYDEHGSSQPRKP